MKDPVRQSRYVFLTKKATVVLDGILHYCGLKVHIFSTKVDIIQNFETSSLKAVINCARFQLFPLILCQF